MSPLNSWKFLLKEELPSPKRASAIKKGKSIIISDSTSIQLRFCDEIMLETYIASEADIKMNDKINLQP